MHHYQITASQVSVHFHCLPLVQIWFLLDLPGGMEKAQLVDRRLLSLHTLRSHPAGGGAVQGDDGGGTEPRKLERLGGSTRSGLRLSHRRHRSGLLKIPWPVTRWLVVVFQAEKKHKSFQELDRFMHYYTRFKNHEHSYQVNGSDCRAEHESALGNGYWWKVCRGNLSSHVKRGFTGRLEHERALSVLCMSIYIYELIT